MEVTGITTEVTGITTDYDTSLEIIEFPCPTPLLDPINCNLMCFIKKKLGKFTYKINFLPICSVYDLTI